MEREVTLTVIKVTHLKMYLNLCFDSVGILESFNISTNGSVDCYMLKHLVHDINSYIVFRGLIKR
jgi:hypothetical protein